MPRGIFPRTEAHRKNISSTMKGKENWLSKLKKNNHARFLEHQKKAGKKGAEVNRKNKTGYYFDKELQSKAGRAAQQKYDYSIIWKDAIKRWKQRDYTGFIRHQKEAGNQSLELHPDLHYNFGANYGSMGGIASASNPDNIERRKRILARYRATPEFKLMVMRNLENRRKNKRHYFKGIYFSSIGELGIAKEILKCGLEEQLVKGKNCHFIINMGNHNFREFDFFIQDKLFVEYHPYDLTGLPLTEYYKQRRKILDMNGFSSKDLVILHSDDEFESKVVGYFQ